MTRKDFTYILNFNDNINAYVDGLYIKCDTKTHLTDKIETLCEKFDFEVINKEYFAPDDLYLLTIREIH